MRLNGVQEVASSNLAGPILIYSLVEKDLQMVLRIERAIQAMSIAQILPKKSLPPRLAPGTAPMENSPLAIATAVVSPVFFPPPPLGSPRRVTWIFAWGP